MKSRSTLILVLVALAVAGLVSLDFKKGTSTDDLEAKRRKIVDLDMSAVTKVELARTNQTIVIEKQGDAWQILQPLKTKADFSGVRSILDELEFAERTRTLHEKDLQGVNLADFGLEHPRIRLTLTTKSGPTTILLGGMTPTKESVYVQIAGKPAVYVVNKSIEDRLDKTLPDLRDRNVLEFTSTDATRLEVKSSDRSIELAKTDGRWRLLQPFNARANQTRIGELLNELGMLRVQDFLSDDPKDVVTYRLNEPVREVSVWKGQGNDPLTLLIGHPVSNDTAQVYAKRKGADAIFTINDATVAKLDLQPNDLRDPNVFAVTAPDVQGVVLQRGANQIALIRTNGSWQITAPIVAPAEEDQVSALLTHLTGLTVKQFTADVASDLEKYGLAVPTLIVTLHGSGTNALAQVLVGGVDASNAVQFVKRADEPFVYGIETNLVADIPSDVWVLRSKHVAQIDPAAVSKLEITIAGNKTLLQRGEDHTWKLVQPVQGAVDEDALNAWLGVFTDLRADKFFDPAGHPAVTAESTALATVGDKVYALALSAPEKDGIVIAGWSEPHSVFQLSAPTVQTLKKNLIKPAK